MEGWDETKIKNYCSNVSRRWIGSCYIRKVVINCTFRLGSVFHYLQPPQNYEIRNKEEREETEEGGREEGGGGREVNTSKDFRFIQGVRGGRIKGDGKFSLKEGKF